MNGMKPSQWLALAGVVAFALYALYTHLQYFGNVSFLGAILLLEIIIASVWKYSERFLVLLMIAFLWAGMNVPLEGAWTGGRWVVLTVGAFAGFVVWMKSPRSHFKSIHLIAFFCVGAAFVSASVSPFLQLAASKALSLLLLFTYCCTGARLALLGREERFFNGLLVASEIAVYGTAACYFGLGAAIWGNPNSLGAAMSIGLFPPLLWGWLTSTAPAAKTRRLIALVLCVYLIYYSMARAGLVAMVLVTMVLCFCLREYKLLTKIGALVLFLVAVTGMISPLTLNERLADAKDTILYKGHKEEGFLGSRKTPWERTVASIKEHPWFGTGYGTSPSGEDPGMGAGEFSSSAETSREHGSSYMTITEWVGLLGVLPFVALLAVTASNVWRVCVWMRRTGNARHYSIPLAMVLLAGFIHANFEDWLFAVGAYPCIYFWTLAFLLADLVPAVEFARTKIFVGGAAPSANFGAVVPNR
ncbi:MAG TPA: O-antigen ligase family protein [Terriglobales bacterium]|nr:O-antigen ligase family protein [Terriglobales bacterium]